MEHHYYYLLRFWIKWALGTLPRLPQVIHSWLVMAILIVGSLLLVKGLKLIPTKGQNVVEVVLQSLENFMVEITGPEGKTFFPYIATIFLYILVSNLIGLIPGFISPTANINTTLSLALCTFVLTHAIGYQVPWSEIYQALYGTHVSACAAYDSDRDDRPPGKGDVFEHAAFRIFLAKRNSWGFCSDWRGFIWHRSRFCSWGSW